MRYFLLGCVVVLSLAQALGRTQLSEESPEINSENLLVLLAPLVLVYGVSLFYLLLEQMRLPFPELRLRRHRHLQPGRLPADGVCLPAAQDHSLSPTRPTTRRPSRRSPAG